MRPQRFQLSRRKGFKLPANTVSVARPSKWGNPYRVGDHGCNGIPYTRTVAVLLFKNYTLPELIDEARRELRGKNLACWCRPGTPCHAEILLNAVNPRYVRPCYEAWVWIGSVLKSKRFPTVKKAKLWLLPFLNNSLPDGRDEWGIVDKRTEKLVAQSANVKERVEEDGCAIEEAIAG